LKLNKYIYKEGYTIMTTEEIYKRTNEVFHDIFDDESIVVTASTVAEDIEEWDSLEHINLVVAIEKEFGVKFKMKEITGMKNVGEMVEIIQDRA